MQPPRARKRHAKPINLQPRDQNILLMIYFCDGLMSQEQLLQFFFPNVHPKNAANRLLALFDNRFLNRNWRPNQWEEFPQLVYWLDKFGYEYIEERLGEVPNRNNKLIRNFRRGTLQHHLLVVDVRLKIIQDVEKCEALNLGRWLTDGYFRSKAWDGKVSFQTSNGKKIERGVQPDGFFPIWRRSSEHPDKRQVFAFALEVDRGTERQKSLSNTEQTTIDEKLRKGAALLDSDVYRQAFKLKTGRLLMITTGWERAENMMYLARKAGVAWAWYFTTISQATNTKYNIITDPIWRKADSSELGALIPATPVDSEK